VERVLGSDAAGVASLLDSAPELANVTDDSPARRPVLHLAAKLGAQPIVELLLVAGADPNRRDAVGKTPVELAVAAGELGCVEVLVGAGARDLADRARLEAAIAVARCLRDDQLQAFLESLRPER
jgi:ankyrin repeat protein